MQVIVKIRGPQTRKDLAQIIAQNVFDGDVKYSGTGSINGYRFAYQVGPLTLTKENELVGYANLPLDKQNQVTSVMDSYEYQWEALTDELDTPDEADKAPHAGNSDPEGVNVPETQESPADEQIRVVYDEEKHECKVTAATETISKFFGILNQKYKLIKQAIPTWRINTVQGDPQVTTITFDSFWETSSAMEAENGDATPYIMFIERMMQMAKVAKRISSKTSPVTNPKYQFRCFLLRLGFIGKECGPARKVLLSRLEGNSAWLRGSRDA